MSSTIGSNERSRRSTKRSPCRKRSTSSETLAASSSTASSPATTATARSATTSTFRRTLDDILVRAEADEAFRLALIADLETAIAGAGYEPEPRVVEQLRREMDDLRRKHS